MRKKNGFILMDSDEFRTYLEDIKVNRKIRLIQLHHTWQPSYKQWQSKSDAFYWQSNMKAYHMKNGYADIAQHFTICPDGTIITGRDLERIPAGIKGANTGAICIENFGCFDSGGDVMTNEQSKAIIEVVGELLKKFNLDTSAITYHCWWSEDGTSLGDYVKGKSAKTCPGTMFFGGNTRADFENGLKKYVEEYSEGVDMREIEELREEIKSLKEKMVYNYVDENMPEWAKDGVRWCIENGIIKGDGNGLGLDDKDLKYCTMFMRLGGMLNG